MNHHNCSTGICSSCKPIHITYSSDQEQSVSFFARSILEPGNRISDPVGLILSPPGKEMPGPCQPGWEMLNTKLFLTECSSVQSKCNPNQLPVLCALVMHVHENVITDHMPSVFFIFPRERERERVGKCGSLLGDEEDILR